ncbi:hypothetical protein KEM55_000104 [Ascosphaera atra]|nr:hypothetical protein KEM55_000104 [Ascosphaera atra]
MAHVQTTYPSESSMVVEVSEEDRLRLSQSDEEYKCHDWDDIKDIIARNALHRLRRKPSDLERYLEWSQDIKRRYGTVARYICEERLKWPIVEDYNSLVVNPVPFADPRDYKILYNDWPYGLTPDITHLCVWLKNDIPINPLDGDLTPESRKLIDDFVNETFVKRLEPLYEDAQDRVRWFKNWAALQSVKALPHIHVMVKDAPHELVVEWTGEEHGKI